MLGICIPDEAITAKSFIKPIRLLPGDIVKTIKSGDKTMYFIKRNGGLIHIPDPVYTIGEKYYLKAPYKIIDEEYVYPHNDASGFKNKATMPEKAARKVVEITSVNAVIAMCESLVYLYNIEIQNI